MPENVNGNLAAHRPAPSGPVPTPRPTSRTDAHATQGGPIGRREGKPGLARLMIPDRRREGRGAVPTRASAPGGKLRLAMSRRHVQRHLHLLELAAGVHDTGKGGLAGEPEGSSIENTVGSGGICPSHRPAVRSAKEYGSSVERDRHPTRRRPRAFGRGPPQPVTERPPLRRELRAPTRRRRNYSQDRDGRAHPFRESRVNGRSTYPERSPS